MAIKKVRGILLSWEHTWRVRTLQTASCCSGTEASQTGIEREILASHTE